MKINVAKFTVSHSHNTIKESKEVPFNTDLTLEGLEIEVPVEEAIETMKAGGAEIAKQFLSILAEDCKQNHEVRRMEADARIMEAKNEAERLKQAKENR